MRRLLFSLLAMSLVSVAAGCRATHGVCDCGCDYEDSCSYRAPWVDEGVPHGNIMPHGNMMPPGAIMPPGNITPRGEAPAPAPEIREALPNAPKKL